MKHVLFQFVSVLLCGQLQLNISVPHNRSELRTSKCWMSTKSQIPLLSFIAATNRSNGVWDLLDIKYFVVRFLRNLHNL